MITRKDKSAVMSIPEVRTLHGVQIKKLPIGRYIRLLQHAESFLPDILTALFPDGTISLTALTTDGVQSFIARALTVVPEKLCEAAGLFLDIPPDRLLHPDDGLTPVELAEIFVALWEVNDLSDFFPTVRKLGSLIGFSQTTGYSGG